MYSFKEYSPDSTLAKYDSMIAVDNGVVRSASIILMYCSPQAVGNNSFPFLETKGRQGLPLLLVESNSAIFRDELIDISHGFD